MSDVAMGSNANLDDAVDHEIAGFLDPAKPQSFFLYAGAGSGKTRSLVKALNAIRRKFGRQLAYQGKRVGVITYTNAACDEIQSRIDFSSLFYVSTIHSFSWDLIKNFSSDIREWLRAELQADINRLREEEAKGRPGTKASITRQAQIESKTRRLDHLDTIQKFAYNPTGENREPNALNHSEVIAISANFVTSKPLMQWILIGRFPFLLIDESQDTNRHLMDAFLHTADKHESRFALGLFGDVMQRIYADGKEKIEESLPASWPKPSKMLNHRCPKRVVALINKIRSEVNTHVQVPRTDAIEGCVRLFICRTDASDKSAVEDSVRQQMADVADDESWREQDSCKTLTLEHHMAAVRLGFSGVFDPLYQIDEWRTGLLDGTFPPTRFFAQNVLPLVEAQQSGDKFAVARIVRNNCPFLSVLALKEASDPGDLLKSAQAGVDDLAALWKKGEPTCAQVLMSVADSKLFEIPDRLSSVLGILQKGDSDDSEEAEPDDPITPETSALLTFLKAPFGQIDLYRQYVSGLAPFDTHQGVKGREFDRVMVIMDDAQARGFMFGFEKLLGARAASQSDIKNVEEGKETGIDRTRRLLYVTCSRAEKSLALVAYTDNPSAVKSHVLDSEWFAENEVCVLA